MARIFNLEWKIRWEELSPSLQAKFIQLILDTVLAELQNPKSNIYKQVVSNIVNEMADPKSDLYKQTVQNIITEMSNPTSNLYKTLINDIRTEINNPKSDLFQSFKTFLTQEFKNDTDIMDAVAIMINNSITSSSSALYKSLVNLVNKAITDALNGKDGEDGLYGVFRTMLFMNLPPKVGFLDDTIVPIYGSYNMSYCMNEKGYKVIDDSEGREIMFYRGQEHNYSGATAKLYRAYRMKETDNFLWENNPVIPRFCKQHPSYNASAKNLYANDIYSLANEYAVMNIAGIGTCLILTNGSGTPDNWSNATGWFLLSGLSGVVHGMVRLVKNISTTSKIVYYITSNVVSENYADLVDFNIGWTSGTYRNKYDCYGRVLKDSSGNIITEKNYNRKKLTDPTSRSLCNDYRLMLYIHQVIEDNSTHTIRVVKTIAQKGFCIGHELWGTFYANSGQDNYINRMGYIRGSYPTLCFNSNKGELFIIASYGTYSYYINPDETTEKAYYIQENVAELLVSYKVNVDIIYNLVNSYTSGTEYFLPTAEDKAAVNRYRYFNELTPAQQTTQLNTIINPQKQRSHFVRNPYEFYGGYYSGFNPGSPSIPSLTFSPLTNKMYYVSNQWDTYYQNYRSYKLNNQSTTDLFSADSYNASSLKKGQIIQNVGYSKAATIGNPDVAPWSKKTLSILILEDSYMMRCMSTTYGSRAIYMKPELWKDPNGNIINNNIFTCKVGEWSLNSGWGYEIVDPYMSACRNTADKSKHGGQNWYRLTISSNIINIYRILPNKSIEIDKVDSNNKKIVVNDCIQVDSSNIIKSITCNLDPNNNKDFKYGILYGYNDGKNSLGECVISIRFAGSQNLLPRDKLGNVIGSSPSPMYTVPSKTQYQFEFLFGMITKWDMNGNATNYNFRDFTMLIWDASTQTFIPYYDWEKALWETPYNNNRSQNTSSNNSGRSNIFFDSDGIFYFRTWYTNNGIPGSYTPLWWSVNLFTKTIKRFPNYYYWAVSYIPIGYTNSWGYYRSCALDGIYGIVDIHSTKDYFVPSNTKNEYNVTIPDNIEQILKVANTSAGQDANKAGYGWYCFRKRMYATSSTGKLAYLQPLTIFLGGYCTTIETGRTIYLNNGDNYIYLYRKTDSYDVDIEIYDHMIGVEGGTSFNRILCSKITCSNDVIVPGGQKDYEINFYASHVEKL